MVHQIVTYCVRRMDFGFKLGILEKQPSSDLFTVWGGFTKRLSIMIHHGHNTVLGEKLEGKFNICDESSQTLDLFEFQLYDQRELSSELIV